MDRATGDPDDPTRRDLLSLGGIAAATALSGGWLLGGVGPRPDPGNEAVPPGVLRFDSAGEGTPVVMTLDTLLGTDAENVPWFAEREGLDDEDALEMLQFSIFRGGDDPATDDPAGRILFPRRVSIAVLDRRGDYAVVEGILSAPTFLTSKGLQEGGIVEVELPTAGTGPPVRRPDREGGTLGVDVSEQLHLEDIVYELGKRFGGRIRGRAGPGVLDD